METKDKLGNSSIGVSKWKGKVWNALGDSITAGYMTTKTYHQYIQENLDIGVVNNYGIPGTEICTSGTFPNPFVKRYMNMEPEANVITVFGGTNDYGHNATLGVMDSRGNSTFYGALHTICKGLYDLYPKAKYGFFTPLRFYDHEHLNGELANSKSHKLVDYVNAIKEVCAYYSIPVLDLYNMAGLTPYVPSVKVRLMPDGLHPNEEGHEIISSKIQWFLESL